MSADTAFRQLRNANPVLNPAALRERRQDAAAFFATTQQRSRGMQTQDKAINVGQLEPPRPPRRRWRVPALAGAATVIIAIVVAFALLTGDDEPDVTNQAPVPTTVVPDQEGALTGDDEPGVSDQAPAPTTEFGQEGAASLIGISGRVTGGVASSRPDFVHFDEDGTFRVELRGDTIDNGTYQVDGEVISFVSEPSVPVWQYDPLMGPGDPSASIGGNFPCDGLAGEYRVVFEGTTFTFEAVWDECRPRIAVAKGLQMELLTG